MGSLISPALVVNVDIDLNADDTFSGQGAYADADNDYWNSSTNSLNDLTASDGITLTSLSIRFDAMRRKDSIKKDTNPF